MVVMVLQRFACGHSDFIPPGHSETSERSRHRPCLHQLPAWHCSLVVHISPQPGRSVHSRVFGSHSSLVRHWPDDSQFSQNFSAVQIFPAEHSSRLVHSGGRPASLTGSTRGHPVRSTRPR